MPTPRTAPRALVPREASVNGQPLSDAVLLLLTVTGTYCGPCSFGWHQQLAGDPRLVADLVRAHVPVVVLNVDPLFEAVPSAPYLDPNPQHWCALHLDPNEHSCKDWASDKASYDWDCASSEAGPPPACSILEHVSFPLRLITLRDCEAGSGLSSHSLRLPKEVVVQWLEARGCTVVTGLGHGAV